MTPLRTNSAGARRRNQSLQVAKQAVTTGYRTRLAARKALVSTKPDLCPTSSGRFRCSRGAAGHDGECVTREPSKPWVGPASRRPSHIATLQRDGTDSRLVESLRQVSIAGTTLTEVASSPAGAAPAPDASTRQKGA